jgi:hypothetical protein
MATKPKGTEEEFSTNPFPFMYPAPPVINTDSVETKTFVALDGRINQYVEYTPRNPVVVRGGFSPGNVSAEDRSVRMRAFPPLPITAYRNGSSENKRSLDYPITSAKVQEQYDKSYLEKPSAIPKKKSGNRPASNWFFDSQDSGERGGASTDPDQGHEGSESGEDQAKKDTIPKIDPAKGEIWADKINFGREAWVERIPGASGMILSGEEQREDFIVSRSHTTHAPYSRITDT